MKKENEANKNKKMSLEYDFLMMITMMISISISITSATPSPTIVLAQVDGTLIQGIDSKGEILWSWKFPASPEGVGTFSIASSGRGVWWSAGNTVWRAHFNSIVEMTTNNNRINFTSVSTEINGLCSFGGFVVCVVEAHRISAFSATTGKPLTSWAFEPETTLWNCVMTTKEKLVTRTNDKMIEFNILTGERTIVEVNKSLARPIFEHDISMTTKTGKEVIALTHGNTGDAFVSVGNFKDDGSWKTMKLESLVRPISVAVLADEPGWPMFYTDFSTDSWLFSIDGKGNQRKVMKLEKMAVVAHVMS